MKWGERAEVEDGKGKFASFNHFPCKQVKENCGKKIGIYYNRERHSVIMTKIFNRSQLDANIWQHIL